MRNLASAMLSIVLLVISTVTAMAQDHRPGMGPSTDRPVGRTFDWPPGLVVPHHFKGYDPNDCRRRPEDPTDEARGLQTYVRIYLAVMNTTPAPIRLTLPAGLLFVSVDDETQNGLLISVETFEIPPGDEPYFVKLTVWCANENRSPSSSRDEFELGPVTDDQRILQAIEQLAGRTLVQADAHIVQDIIWHATEGKELDDYHHEWLGRGG